VSHPSQAQESFYLPDEASKIQWLLSVEARLLYQTSDTVVGFAIKSHSIAELTDHEQPDPYSPELS
jgi:hypothetical protein